MEMPRRGRRRVCDNGNRGNRRSEVTVEIDFDEREKHAEVVRSVGDERFGERIGVPGERQLGVPLPVWGEMTTVPTIVGN